METLLNMSSKEIHQMEFIQRLTLCKGHRVFLIFSLGVFVSQRFKTNCRSTQFTYARGLVTQKGFGEEKLLIPFIMDKFVASFWRSPLRVI